MSKEFIDFRQTVLDRLKEIGWSNYDLAYEAEACGVASKSTVYEWINGKQANIGTVPLSIVLAVLNLRIVKGKPPKKTERKRKRTAPIEP